MTGAGFCVSLGGTPGELGVMVPVCDDVSFRTSRSTRTPSCPGSEMKKCLKTISSSSVMELKGSLPSAIEAFDLRVVIELPYASRFDCFSVWLELNFELAEDER